MKIILAILASGAILATTAFAVLSPDVFGARSFENPDTSVAEELTDRASFTGDGEESSDAPIAEEPDPVPAVSDAEPAISVGADDEPEAGVPVISASVGSEEPAEVPDIVDRLVPFGHEDRAARDIDTVVIHSSYDALGDEPYSVSGIIEEYRQYGVAAHYLIDRKGTVYRLVEDRDVAYHAGVSRVPDGRTGVNAFSLGIELVGKDTDSPTSSQYAGLRALLGYLRGKYAIKYVLGHSDIAPGRKTDPWNFDWGEIE